MSFAACALAATVWGCSTTYQATAPRPVQAGNVQASVELVRGTKVAEVRVTAADQSSAASGPVLKAARLGTQEEPPCTSRRLLGVVAESGMTTPDEPRRLLLRPTERIEVLLPSRLGSLSHRGLTLDLAFDDDDSSCARLPLTGTGRDILWRGSPGWGGSGHLRLEWPAVSAGGIGAGVTAEMRFHHPFRFWGDWRLAFGLPFGWVGCRRDCPGWGLHSDDKTTTLFGFFTHIGATASVARMAPVGRWLFVPAVGFRTSAYLLGAPSDFAGDRFAAAAGPFATLGILRTHGESPPSFDPVPTARRGIEISVGALGTYGRSPRDTVWLLGIGWVFTDVD